LCLAFAQQRFFDDVANVLQEASCTGMRHLTQPCLRFDVDVLK